MPDKMNEQVSLHRIRYLFFNYMDKTCTKAEEQELAVIVLTSAYEPIIAELEREYWEKDVEAEMSDTEMERHLQKVLLPHRANVKRILWSRVAVASVIVCILATAAYYWLLADKLPVEGNITQQLPLDKLQARKGAVLTLADGTEMILDSLSKGMVALQNGSKVMFQDNQLAYEPVGNATENIVYNSISTPIGQQFNITLSDGTKVYLNAASSMKFPANFTGNERRIEIVGEVYLEVVKNTQQPFVVVASGVEVIVLGTKFNINAYKDDGDIKTTLLEGSVKVIKLNELLDVGDFHSNRNVEKLKDDFIILKPGEQAITATDGKIALVENVNIDQAVAWKNGLFNFSNSSITTVMKQLERWYGIQMKYEGKAPDLIFQGEMYRNVNLSDVLDMLQKMGVKFRSEDNIIYIEK